MNLAQLASYFKESYFQSNLQSNNKDDVLKELVKPLIESGSVTRENILLETLYQRETLGSFSSSLDCSKDFK